MLGISIEILGISKTCDNRLHTPPSPVGLVKDQQMLSNILVVDQAAQVYDIYLIYVCVGATEADAKGHT